MKPNKDKFIEDLKENQVIIDKICFGYTYNTEDRNDLKQEIFIQLWKAYPKFNHESKISTWIYRVALNTAISNFRKTKRKIQLSELTETDYQIPQAEESNESHENVTQLYQLIHQLNDLEKAIILLYLDDQPYREIAEIVGISESNVATKINRIKIKLKEQFNKK